MLKQFMKGNKTPITVHHYIDRKRKLIKERSKNLEVSNLRFIDKENPDAEPLVTCKPARRFDSKLKQSINHLISGREMLGYDYFSTKDLREIKEEVITLKKLDGKAAVDENYLEKSDDVFINLEIV